MGEETTNLGSINISPNVVATIAYHATLQSYGIVGLAPKNLAEGLAQTITREPAKGVTVHYDGDNIDIEIYVVVEYGTHITSVAASVADTVRYQVEKTLGLHVNSINIHIAGLRISDMD
ncbi:MAG: Asp23/Gls24 family envelope stress response protein [Anaerolineales bacterium]|nr:Asp23/Gls24 family envelope stress response protein [Anaerolineales bacterium]